MGKNKYATKKGSIFTEKSHSSESEYEKLVAYAEKMGKQIWEVTEEDLKMIKMKKRTKNRKMKTKINKLNKKLMM